MRKNSKTGILGVSFSLSNNCSKKFRAYVDFAYDDKIRLGNFSNIFEAANARTKFVDYLQNANDGIWVLNRFAFFGIDYSWLRDYALGVSVYNMCVAWENEDKEMLKKGVLWFLNRFIKNLIKSGGDGSCGDFYIKPSDLEILKPFFNGLISKEDYQKWFDFIEKLFLE